MIKEAEKRGVDKDRIIFAEKMQTDEHLKRMKFIDLFLDTYPYGAHVTASEALRMGVPVLTMMGNSFASRVAGSMLECVGLKQLITNNLDEYTKSAIELRHDHHKLQNIKNYLFYGYDGTLISSKTINLPWHRIKKKNHEILPKFLRKYPSDYNFLEKILFYFLKFLLNPKKYLLRQTLKNLSLY